MKEIEKINLVVGFDQREAIAYHVFCQSVIDNTTLPVLFLPLSLAGLKGYQETHGDGSNSFIYSRFLRPYLMSYKGWAIFADGDMVCRQDLKLLWDLKDSSKAVQVVKHNYRTKYTEKYLGNKNEDYPRKNWSSLILWNCSHAKHKLLTPEFIQKQTGAFLHRFTWLDDEDIGDLDNKWNWLAIEYEDIPDANLVHYTLGTPCFKDYKNTPMASEWHKSYERLKQGFD